MANTENAQSKSERNKKLMEDYLADVWNKLDPAACRKYKPENFVSHLPGGVQITSRDGFEEWAGTLFKTLDGPMHSTLQLLLADGDYVVVRASIRLPAEPGKWVDKVFVDIFRIEDDLIAEHWAYE
jgi:predicted SnoaL-like aldol condensation-catalyzing enzyme